MPFAGFSDFDTCVSKISPKNNPRTDKPYGKEIASKICGKLQAKHEKKKKDMEYKSQFLPLPAEIKGTHFEAVLSTSALDLGNDIVTKECLMDIVNQVMSSGASFKGSYLHDTIIERDSNLPPLSKLDSAEYLPDGQVKFLGTFNESHPEWAKIFPMIENGFLDGISLEYKPEPTGFRHIEKEGKSIRELNKVKFWGYGHVPRPMNMDSAIMNVFQKSFEQFKQNEIDEVTDEEIDATFTQEVNSMEETKEQPEPPETKEQPIPAVETGQPTNELAELKSQLEAKEKELAEVKARINDKPYIEEIKSLIESKLKDLQPQTKALIPSETEVKEMPNFGLADVIRATYGG